MNQRKADTDAHARQARANRLGVLAMIGSMACFIANDALVKYASQALPATQLIFIRGVMATLLVLAVRDLVTRRVHASVPSILITVSNTIAVTLLAGGLSLLEGWRPLPAFETGLVAVAAVFLATAYYLLVISTRHGDLSLIAPFRYIALPFAMIAGFVVWGDIPNVLAWCGIGLVIGSGIYVLRAAAASRRERAVAQSS